MVAAQKSFGQHVQKARRMCRTTEEEANAMDFKFHCEVCETNSLTRTLSQPTAVCTARQLHPALSHNPVPARLLAQ